MSKNKSYGSTLRLLACLSAVDVLYRVGLYAGGRRILSDNTRLAHSVPDLSLRARYYLALAWAHQRGSTGKPSNRAVEAALNKATLFAENSGDRAALGSLASRTAGYMTKRQAHEEAVNQSVLALEAYLITGNFDSLQGACGNIGSIIHRLGPTHYPEARQWLLLSILVARIMNLGRDDAHAEMILAKIYVENGDRTRSRWLLERADRTVERAGNQVNLGDIKMVWGFWHRRFGVRKQEIATLVDALRIFRGLVEFDTAQKEKYIRERFPDVWSEVVALLRRDSYSSCG